MVLLFEPLQAAWRNVVLDSRAGDVCGRSSRKPFLHTANLLTREHSAPQEFLLRSEYTLKKSRQGRPAGRPNRRNFDHDVVREAIVI